MSSRRGGNPTWRSAALSALLVLCLGAPASAVVQTFGAGSLIIPMDTGTSGQNNGMLRAFGLVYALLREGVPVSWVINPSKGVNGDDFAISIASVVQDFRTGATIATPRSYRGGPFLIAATDAAAASPIITAWQAVAGDQTAVHRLVGAGSVTQDVAATLLSAPRIAVLKVGDETIAFNSLNAAGILDSIGGTWTPSSPDLLTEADVEGATDTTDDDGVLFTQSGSPRKPRYCFLAGMHYLTTSRTNEVVQEARQWLGRSALVHAFMQCEAARVFENATGGLFLTNAGIDDDGSPTNNPNNLVPSSPLTQMDGTFQADEGSVDSMRANIASPLPDYKTGVTTLINDAASPITQRITLLTGRADGVGTKGRVTYLGGHDYSVDLPMSTNPQTNGVRLFLDAILASDCASTAQTKLTMVKTAPATVNTSEIPYSITITSPAAASTVAEAVKLVDKLPAGTTYVAGSASPAPTTNTSGQLTWNLPPIAPGQQSTVTFKVSVTIDGTYTNAAKVYYAMLTESVVNASATTTRDTVAPTVNITSGPSGPSHSTSASFGFTTGGAPVVTECRIDAASYADCTGGSFSASGLAPGPHTFMVHVVDAAGNQATASRSFSVVSAIGDRVWRDVDADGVQDGGESGIDSVTVQLLDSGNAVLATTTTSGGGFYVFDGLAAGTYKVHVVPGSLPAFHLPTYDLDGTATPHLASVTVGAAESRSDVDFGYRVAPPVVTSVDSVRDAVGGLDDGEATAVPITQLYVAFSRALDGFSATTIANYRLVTTGADRLLQTASCGGLTGDDAAIPIENVIWDAPALTARVLIQEPHSLAAGSYRLLVCATLQGDDGVALDGDGDTQPGGDFRRDFTVTETDLLANPSFDSGLGHWSVSEPHAGDTQGDSEDAESKPTSGSATVMTTGVAGDYVLSQCADFTGVGQVRGEAVLRSQSALAGVPHATVTIDFFPISGCSGSPIAPATVTAASDGDTADAFLLLIAGPVTVPPSAQSARLSLRLHGNAGEAYASTWDNAFLGTTKTLFASSFEVDVALEWGGKYPP